MKIYIIYPNSSENIANKIIKIIESSNNFVTQANKIRVLKLCLVMVKGSVRDETWIFIALRESRCLKAMMPK